MRKLSQNSSKALRGFLATALFTAFAAWNAAAAQEPGSTVEAGPEFEIAPAPGGTYTQPLVEPGMPLFVSADKPVKIEQTLDRAIITVGDLIEYTMTIEAPEGLEMAIPPPGAQLGQFIIRDYKIPEPEEKDGRVTQKYIFTITAYVTGEIEIPPMPVFVNPTGDSPQVIITEGIQLRVAAVTNPEDLQVRDLKKPVSIPLDYRPYILASAGALALLGAAAMVLFYLYRYRPASEPMPEPVRPAHETAYQELRELESLRLLEAGEVEAFYTKLSEIIRRYIALRFRIYALEYTTMEILDALRDRTLETRAYERIRWFLEETDLVKFARYMPAEKARGEVIKKSREIIDWTRESEMDLLAAETALDEKYKPGQERRTAAQ